MPDANARVCRRQSPFRAERIIQRIPFSEGHPFALRPAPNRVVEHGSLTSFGRCLAGLAALFLAAAWLRPAILNPLNRIWLKFGLMLHSIVNPVVMALLFYGTVLPTGLVARAMGKDLLRLKRQPDAESYWIVRKPAGPSPETMKDQF